VLFPVVQEGAFGSGIAPPLTRLSRAYPRPGVTVRSLPNLRRPPVPRRLHVSAEIHINYNS